MIRRLQHGEQPPAGVEPGRYLGAGGYIRLRWRVGPGELVECYEHRWVMGNPPSDVHVHHRNGVKDDNRPENLEVVTPAEHRREHQQINDAEVARLYATGMSTPEVGRAIGHDAAAVYRSLVRSGVTPRSLSESQRRHDLDDEEIRRLRLEGVSARGIARRLSCSPSAIDVRVKAMGLSGPPGRQPRR